MCLMYTNQSHAYANVAAFLTDLFCTVYHSAQCPLMQSVTVGSRPANISQTARCQDVRRRCWGGGLWGKGRWQPQRKTDYITINKRWGVSVIPFACVLFLSFLLFFRSLVLSLPLFLIYVSIFFLSFSALLSLTTLCLLSFPASRLFFPPSYLSLPPLFFVSSFPCALTLFPFFPSSLLPFNLPFTFQFSSPFFTSQHPSPMLISSLPPLHLHLLLPNLPSNILVHFLLLSSLLPSLLNILSPPLPVGWCILATVTFAHSASGWNKLNFWMKRREIVIGGSGRERRGEEE